MLTAINNKNILLKQMDRKRTVIRFGAELLKRHHNNNTRVVDITMMKSIVDVRNRNDYNNVNINKNVTIVTTEMKNIANRIRTKNAANNNNKNVKNV